jgi:RNA polymerase sigma-70 factor (ECF subfamily)
MSRTPSQRIASSMPGALSAPPLPSYDSTLAGEVKALVLAGHRDAARERYDELVTRQQRRALRIAYLYLRDPHDADEAVQDAFVKVFVNIRSYREQLPFEVWFTKILINACLDARKARSRRLQWFVPTDRDAPAALALDPPAKDHSPEQRLLSAERAREITDAVGTLPERQRMVFTLCQVNDHTPAEVSEALGLSEATVRVHLFRAIRKLRTLLEHGR